MYNEVVYEAPVGLEIDMHEDTTIESGDTRYAYRFVKRAFDIVFSAIVIVLLFIPCVVLCIVLMIDSPGSPIFRQKRMGKTGKQISVLKFRTMVIDSNNLEKYFTPEQIRHWKVDHKIDKDPRITRLGSFLRKTSLDELPQFINVLKSEMSVIGPRPITEEELEFYGKDSSKLLSVKPGITGWWQVTQRSKSSFVDGSRQTLELYYIENRSVHLDMTIFFKTFSTIIRKTGI